MFPRGLLEPVETNVRAGIFGGGKKAWLRRKMEAKSFTIAGQRVACWIGGSLRRQPHTYLVKRQHLFPASCHQGQAKGERRGDR